MSTKQELNCTELKAKRKEEKVSGPVPRVSGFPGQLLVEVVKYTD
ncbi:MAG: hypothetical protein ACOCUK_01565 [bacterium]